MDLEYEIIRDKIIRFPRVLSKYDYAKLVEDSNPEWEPNIYISDKDGSTRWETVYKYNNITPEGKFLFETMHEVSVFFSEQILGKTSSLSAGLNLSGYSEDIAHVSKYRINGAVMPHTDEEETEDSGWHTIIWYLNDDYTGGELGFTGEPDIEIKAEAGDVYIYPFYMEHYANPVTDGFKYIAIRREKFY